MSRDPQTIQGLSDSIFAQFVMSKTVPEWENNCVQQTCVLAKNFSCKWSKIRKEMAKKSSQNSIHNFYGMSDKGPKLT